MEAGEIRSLKYFSKLEALSLKNILFTFLKEKAFDSKSFWFPSSTVNEVNLEDLSRVSILSGHGAFIDDTFRNLYLHFASCMADPCNSAGSGMHLCKPSLLVQTVFLVNIQEVGTEEGSFGDPRGGS